MNKLKKIVYSLRKSGIRAGKQMETKYGIWAILGMCVLILFLGGVKKKSEYILNFLVRVVVGLVCIYFANEFLAMQGISVSVGMNPYTAGILGVLGTGGFFLLYGISFCHYFL